jgi:hypothetical protein
VYTTLTRTTITTVSVAASVLAFIDLIATYGSIISPSSSQISLDLQLSPPRVSLLAQPARVSPELEQQEAQPPVQKQLAPNRPEVLIQAYEAEKAAWLAQHPTVRPTEYRRARKWKNRRPKVLKEQAFYMPRERRDLNGTIIAIRAN